MQTDGFMPANAFSSILIQGLIKVNNIPAPLTCSRRTPKPAKSLFFKNPIGVPYGPPRIRPPSKLPPPGDLCLRASLQPKRLGHGRIGSVYSISNDDSGSFSLPPLVIKVSARHRSEKLAREAWFYEEMEEIQGSSIARCYGIFTAEIDPKSEVLHWAESDKDFDPNEIDESEDDNENANFESDESSTGNVSSHTKVEDEDTKEEGPRVISNHLDPPTNSVHNHACQDDNTIEQGPISNHQGPPPPSNQDERTFISVLVLERLGGLMPLKVSLESITPDIYEIYSDIGRFGIEQIDIRWRNILAAPVTHESRVCPHHEHKHQWRIVDFDRARKSNFSHRFIDTSQRSYLDRLFASMPKGYIIEPWE